MAPFDSKKYTKLQKEQINKRISQFDKLYIEVGGKLFDDNHAARVLPGFKPDAKIEIFKELKNDLEIIFCINTNDIISDKIRADNNLSYADEVLRLHDLMLKNEIKVCGIVITFYHESEEVAEFEDVCKKKNIKTYHSYFIDNYPNDLKTILSSDGFGKNDYIKTDKNLILVAAPGANSGKLETCLSQLFLDKTHGINSCYAKYETFPVWNLPLDHLVNIAYEMATVDIADKNMIDPYYKKAYKKIAVNYNRDIAAFPILSNMIKLITGKEIYKSPTDMGINAVAFAIQDDFAVQTAAFEEIKRRNIKHKNLYENGKITKKALIRSEKILKRATKIYNKLIKQNKK